MDPDTRKKLFILIVVIILIIIVIFAILVIVNIGLPYYRIMKQRKEEEIYTRRVTELSEAEARSRQMEIERRALLSQTGSPIQSAPEESLGQAPTQPQTAEMVNPFRCTPQRPNDNSYYAPLRRNNGKVECLTNDGYNCRWTTSQAECDAGGLEGIPLVCDSDKYRSRWGPVSSTSGLWCVRDDI
jgi:hypothetical protein